MNSNVIWIDANLDNKENTCYIKELKTFSSIRLILCKNIDESIYHLKNIYFQDTKIIVSGRLYSGFIKCFRNNSTDICVAPKIIVFAGSKKIS